jgi:hypothetical protein
MTNTIEAAASPKAKRVPKALPAKAAPKAKATTTTAKPKSAAKAKPATTKSKTASKAKTAKSGGPRPYAGSFAEQCDIASMRGGTIEDIAKAAGTTPGVIRGHIKYRTRNGKYKLEETGDQVKLVLVI